MKSDEDFGPTEYGTFFSTDDVYVEQKEKYFDATCEYNCKHKVHVYRRYWIQRTAKRPVPDIFSRNWGNDKTAMRTGYLGVDQFGDIWEQGWTGTRGDGFGPETWIRQSDGAYALSYRSPPYLLEESNGTP